MKKIIYLLITSALITFLNLTGINAQSDEEFKPHGNPFALIFTDVNQTFNKNGNSKSFEITRAYLGYEYYFSKYFYARVNVDVGDPGVGKLQMTAYLKNAYVQYKKNNFSARFGMLNVDQYSLQEKTWGYRYIYKSFMDAYNMGASADLGAALEYSPAKFVSIDFSVLDGEGYKNLQSDSAFKSTIGVSFRPFGGFMLRGYYDVMHHNNTQSTYALFAAYSVARFRAAFEYNVQINNLTISNRDLYGISGYAAFVLNEKFSVFTRYDWLWSDIINGESDPWNNNKDGQLIMAGFDYSPVKGVKIAPTYSGYSPHNKTLGFTSKIGLNFELRF
jgi:hypothetical protein